MDLTLNNLQRLIYHKTQTNKHNITDTGVHTFIYLANLKNKLTVHGLNIHLFNLPQINIEYLTHTIRYIYALFFKYKIIIKSDKNSQLSFSMPILLC